MEKLIEIDTGGNTTEQDKRFIDLDKALDVLDDLEFELSQNCECDAEHGVDLARAKIAELSITSLGKQTLLDNVMTTEEVGQYLGVTRQSINTYQRAGLLMPFKSSKGGNLYYRPDVEAFREKNTGFTMKI